MDTKAISKEIRYFTSGYPYLVSRICKNINDYLNREWTLEGVRKSIKLILKKPNTLFDDIIKNINNYSELKSIIYEILVEGRKFNYNYFAYEKGIIYGLLREKDNKLIISNKIFEEFLYNYIIEDKKIRDLASKFIDVEENQFINNGKLDMEKCIIKFQEVMYEQYRKEDEKFYETHGRLIFLAYLKPILNGKGFSFIEPRTRQNKRMDVVITYGNEKFIVEMKIWNGQKYEERGIHQLKEYLDIQGVEKGYLITFNFNKNKKYTSQWIDVDNKKIFDVIV